MTKPRTSSALVTTPLSDRPSSPHEKETAPDGKKLSPNWRTASASAKSLIPSSRRSVLPLSDASGDPHSARQVPALPLKEPCLEQHLPVMIAGAITSLE